MIDKHSDTWREVAAWAVPALGAARSRLENIGVDPVETENLRGRIAALCDLLALTDEPEQRDIAPAEDYGIQGTDDMA